MFSRIGLLLRTIKEKIKNRSFPILKLHPEDKTIFEYYGKNNSLISPHQHTPQAVQGMWQAYGQIRAARKIALSTLLASGIFALGVWKYNKEAESNLIIERKKTEKTKEDLIKERAKSEEEIAKVKEKAEKELREIIKVTPTNDEVNTQEHATLLKKAKHDIFILLRSRGGYTADDIIFTALEEQAKADVKIRILALDTNHIPNYLDENKISEKLKDKINKFNEKNPSKKIELSYLNEKPCCSMEIIDGNIGGNEQQTNISQNSFIRFYPRIIHNETEEDKKKERYRLLETVRNEGRPDSAYSIYREAALGFWKKSKPMDQKYDQNKENKSIQKKM